ncbi:hypothetical protein CDAR_35271 [Caerostris darwini]|uniref:Uncharacterized protein n=1 Tax=Caerostris darwini TaxID=1538125 RepID=A0AAV4SP76_9ARAC|nr:hypothetical protein CDAR_35271 [Caerostris darwini]
MVVVPERVWGNGIEPSGFRNQGLSVVSVGGRREGGKNRSTLSDSETGRSIHLRSGIKTCLRASFGVKPDPRTSRCSNGMHFAHNPQATELPLFIFKNLFPLSECRIFFFSPLSYAHLIKSALRRGVLIANSFRSQIDPCFIGLFPFFGQGPPCLFFSFFTLWHPSFCL